MNIPIKFCCMKRIALFFSIPIILMSCSTVKQGTIVSKGYEPARYETGAADSGFTAGTYQTHEDEDYVIDVVMKRRSGIDYVQKVFVDKEAFDSLSINQDYIIENKGKSKTEDDELNNQVSHFIIYYHYRPTKIYFR